MLFSNVDISIPPLHTPFHLLPEKPPHPGSPGRNRDKALKTMTLSIGDPMRQDQGGRQRLGFDIRHDNANSISPFVSLYNTYKTHDVIQARNYGWPD